MSLWLDNPKHHHKSHHKKHHKHHHHGHNPYLAAYNPPSVMGAVWGYFSVPYLSAVASGGAGFGITYLGYKTLFGLTALHSYGADPGYTGVAVRAIGRMLVAALGDMFLSRFFSGHNRLAYIGGAAAYVGLSTGLELLGYDVSIGAPGGVPLQSILPAAFQSAAGIAGTGAFVQRPNSVLPNARFAALRHAPMSGAGAFLQRGRLSGLALTPQRLYHNALSPA